MKKNTICVNCFKEYNIHEFLENKNNQKEKNFCKFCGSEIILIDKPILKHFIKLRKKGYHPQFSCAGHYIETPSKFSIPYIALKDEIFVKSKYLDMRKLRGGSAIYPNFEIKSEKDLKRFLQELNNLIEYLPQKKQKKLEYFIPIKPYKLKPISIEFLLGEKRSRKYLKQNNYKKYKGKVEIEKLSEKLRETNIFISLDQIRIRELNQLKFCELKNSLIITIPLKKQFDRDDFN